MTAEQIHGLFEVHSPKDVRQMERKGELREAAKKFALLIGRLTPNSAERTLAIRKAHDAMLMGITAIEVNEK